MGRAQQHDDREHKQAESNNANCPLAKEIPKQPQCLSPGKRGKRVLAMMKNGTAQPCGSNFRRNSALSQPGDLRPEQKNADEQSAGLSSDPGGGHSYRRLRSQDA